MKILTSALIALTFSIQALGAELWVTTSQLSDQDHLERLAETQRSTIKGMDIDSLYDVEMRSPVDQTELSKLFNLESQARNQAVSGEFMTSLKLYLELLERLKKVPNVSGIEKITFSALLHIAELETLLKSPSAPAAWLQAHAWGHAEAPSNKEFSPGVRETFARFKRPRSAGLTLKFPDNALVFVDGKRLPGDGDGDETVKTHVEPGWHQIEAIVAGSAWLIKDVTLAKGEMKTMNLSPQPIVFGTCERPSYAGPRLPKGVRIFADYGDGCSRIYFKKKWFTLSGAPVDSYMDAKPATESASKPSAPRLADIMAPVPKPETQTNWKRLVKSPWFWAGVGVVVAGLAAVVTQNQQPQTVLVPSHTSQ